MNLISPLDFVVAPFLFVIIMLMAFFYSKKNHDKKIRRYFLLGLGFKMFGALILGLIMEFYFGGGDTTYFFRGSQSITRNFFPEFRRTILLLLNDSDYLIKNGYRYNYFTDVYALLSRDSSLAIMKIGGVLGLFSFNTYLGTSIFFALFGFIGTWKIYRVFLDLYPSLYRPLAYVTLFIPTVLIWGSGFLKDPIAMGFLGLLFFNAYRFWFKKQKRIKSVVLMLVSISFLMTIKVYIFLAFMPAFIFWMLMDFRNDIKNPTFKALLLPILLFLFVIVGGFAFNKITSLESFQDYSLEAAAESVSKMSDHYQKIEGKSNAFGQGGTSAFSLGAFDASPMGLIKKMPVAIFATIFRPYPWEARKALNIPTALESFSFLMILLIILIRRKVFLFFKDLVQIPPVTFCIVFTLIFAFVVGISTPNFGTMVRYRIPCLPFFLCAMVILYNIKALELLKKTDLKNPSK